MVKLTTAVMAKGEDCHHSNWSKLETIEFTLQQSPDTEDTYHLNIDPETIPFLSSQDTYRVCLKVGDRFLYQGDEAKLKIQFYSQMMPVWMMGVLVSVLLCLSGINADFSFYLLTHLSSLIRSVLWTEPWSDGS